jgi:WD40 repeat protein
LRIWNVASGKRVAQFDRGVSDESVLLSFCFAPDGATLASASREGIVLLDCANLGGEADAGNGRRRAPQFSRDVADLLSGWSMVGGFVASPEIRLWNTASWESFTLPAAVRGTD